MINEPLASKLRPKSIDDLLGQSHLLSVGQPLYDALHQGMVHSMILWGPPGTGKPTLAKLLANAADADIEEISAVLSGVKEIRAAIDKAKLNKERNRATILFVDEVHRFNKSQQDAFLPFVESGLITFIGATTENPAFELNNALLSRAAIYVLKPLEQEALLHLIDRALATHEITIDSPKLISESCNGDARKCLNILELVISQVKLQELTHISDNMLQHIISDECRLFDKNGDFFYDQISALHKSIRGSSPDASLFWCLTMLKNGCSPQYLLRRLLRIASEDIGNADPKALQIVLNAWDSFERLGRPEGELAITQATLYLSSAPKSNATYLAYKTCLQDVNTLKQPEVPIHLRNAPTSLAKSLNHGKAYQYPHDHPHAFVINENYFPQGLQKQYYFPVERGLEIKIKQKLNFLQQLNG